LQASGNRVSLNMSNKGVVSLSLVNSRGQTIRQIHSGQLSEGRHDFSLAQDVPKGVYWLVLKNTVQILKTQMWVRF